MCVDEGAVANGRRAFEYLNGWGQHPNCSRILALCPLSHRLEQLYNVGERGEDGAWPQQSSACS